MTYPEGAQASAAGDDESAVQADTGVAVGVGLDRAAIEASYQATLSAAKWLLGTAGAFATLLLAGIGLSDVGNAYGSNWRESIAVGSVLAAAGAIIWVLARATQVLSVPYRDLTSVLQIREKYRRDREWTKDWAGDEFTRAGRAVAAASGGQLSDLPALHREIQELRNQANPDQPKLSRDDSIARVAVAVANDMEISRRFGRLKVAYFLAIPIVLGAAAVFVLATTRDPDSVQVKSPVAVRISPESKEWPSPLSGCDQESLLGTAVRGSWPHPEFSTIGSKACTATVSGEAAHRFVLVPLVDPILHPK